MKKYFFFFLTALCFLGFSNISYGQKSSKANSLILDKDSLKSTPKHKMDSKKQNDSKQPVDVEPTATPPKEMIILKNKKNPNK